MELTMTEFEFGIEECICTFFPPLMTHHLPPDDTPHSPAQQDQHHTKAYKPLLVAREEARSTSVLVGAAGGGGDATGMMIWPGAIAMARYIWSVGDTLLWTPQLRIVELGCGCGAIAGVLARAIRRTASRRRERSRTIASSSSIGGFLLYTDGLEEAVTRAKYTVEHDASVTTTITTPTDPPPHDSTPHMVNAVGAVYSWSDAGKGAIDLLQRHSAPSPSSSFSSSSTSYRDTFCADIVIGAEIVYPSTSFASLLDLFSATRCFLFGENQSTCIEASSTATAGTGAGAGLLSSSSSSSSSSSFLLDQEQQERGHYFPRQGDFIMSYVQRRPETTLILLTAAWIRGFRDWIFVPWSVYSKSEPPLGACVLLFRYNYKGNNDVATPPTTSTTTTTASTTTIGTRLNEQADVDDDDVDDGGSGSGSVKTREFSESEVFKQVCSPLLSTKVFQEQVNSAFPNLLQQLENAEVARKEAAEEEWAAPPIE